MAIKEKLINGNKVYEVTVSRRVPRASKDDKTPRKRHQTKRHVSNFADAKRLERQLFAELDRKISGKRKVTWNEFLEIYFQEIALRKLKQPSTTTNEFYNLHRHVSPRWGDRLMSDITSNEVRKLIMDAVGDKSEQTKKSLVGHIRSVFKVAQELEYVTKNPALYITFKVPTRQKSLPPFEDIQRLLTVARDQKLEWFPVWLFLAATGCRSGEAYAVKWRNVDLHARTILIAESWTRHGGERAATKNGQWRVVPVNHDLFDMLTELKATTFQGPNSYVLPRIREWAQSEGAKLLRHFMIGLGIEPMRLHDFRSFFITELLRRGQNLPTVMRLIDHKRLETTMKYVALAGLNVTNSTESLNFFSNNSDSTKEASEPPVAND